MKRNNYYQELSKLKSALDGKGKDKRKYFDINMKKLETTMLQDNTHSKIFHNTSRVLFSCQYTIRNNSSAKARWFIWNAHGYISYTNLTKMTIIILSMGMQLPLSTTS